MKKKNVLMMALSLCLVAVIAVGGTLAYLSDSAGTLTNTFEFANGITVTLSETWTEANQKWNETASAVTDDSDNVTGYAYTNLAKGQDAYKAPVVDVKTDVPTYVFVEVAAGNGVSIVTEDNAAYAAGLGTWKTDPTLPENTYYTEITGDQNWTLFDTIHFADEIEGPVGNVTIKVKAIQKAKDLDTVLKAYNAVQYQ